MARHVVRTLAAFATGALLTLGFAPGALAASGSATEVGRPAVAAADVGHPAVAAVAAQAKGYCDPSDTGSVTVVVDFSGVGGGIDIRCSSGSTGQQALANAFSYSEVASQPGFVCQIEGAPASDCQVTPPGSAYWSYWQAAPGGGWSYSTRGFSSSRVRPGGFEGWAFGSGGAPGIDPVLPAAPEPEPPVPEQPANEQPAPEAEAPAAPEPEQPAAQPAAQQPGAETAPDTGTQNGAAAADSTTESAAVVDPAAEAAAAAAEAAAQAAAAAQVSVAEAAAAAASASASASSSSTSSSAASSSATTSAGGSADLSANQSTAGPTIWFSLVALLAVASLGTAAVVMSRRRRSGAGDDQAG